MTPRELIPVFDGHNDTLKVLYQQPERDFFRRAEAGHLDLPRAQEGGFVGGFFAIFPPSGERIEDLEEKMIRRDGGYEVPPSAPLPPEAALQHTLAMASGLFRLERRSQGRLKVVRSVAEIRSNMAQGGVSAILHFEGAEAIGTDLSALEVFYQAGLRSLGIVWSRPNAFGHGVPFAFPRSPDTGPGLTPAGRELVRACNELRILIDVSHLNERGFWDVAELSDAPLVATHSNAHALCPVTRNLTDAQLDAIRDRDGMVGLNFAVTFLREDGESHPDTPLETMVRHIDYLVEKVGPERVGFGSDFDGAQIPTVIGDVTGVQRLLAALEQHGYGQDALRKLAFENWLAVLERTWGH